MTIPTFKQYLLTEVLDRPLPWKWYRNHHNDPEAKFKTPKGQEILVTFMEFRNEVNINFYEYKDDDTNAAITGKGEEFAIFATVIAIIMDYIDNLKSENVEKITFRGNKSEGNRTSLYTRLFKKYVNKHSDLVRKSEILNLRGSLEYVIYL